MTGAMIATRSLRKGFGTTVALAGVDLDVPTTGCTRAAARACGR